RRPAASGCLQGVLAAGEAVGAAGGEEQIRAWVSGGLSREPCSMAVSYAPIRAAWLPGSPELTSWPTAWMHPRSRGVGDPVVGALSIDAFVSPMVRPCCSTRTGMPQLLT